METSQTPEAQKDNISQDLPSEGVIKFEYNIKHETSRATIKNYDDIEFYRRLLYPTKIIGFDQEENVGYGNLSKRSEHLEFIITASQTGHLPELVTKHYVHIKSCNPTKMVIEAIGLMPPSSETLTHYSIYEAAPAINHVFHGHHEKLWKFMVDNDYPSTPEDITYGTLQMSEAVKSLVKNKESGVFVMKGHYGGFVSYAKDGREASRNIKKLLNLMDQAH